ncbi:MAG TPA: transcription antitermination factor NusB [Pseudoclavibacter sp.]|nr:transcription antitermination factor NusB [Pseudoclavibacter sp.]
MSARTKARKRAVDLLYSSDVLDRPLADVLAAEAARALEEPSRRVSWEYARTIVSGYQEHADVIDEMISSYSRNWSLVRMPAVDRAILRVAVWEILFNPEVPRQVAIAEAVGLAGELSTDESGAFVNGLLASIAASA